MPYPTKGNLGPSFAHLSEIAATCADLNRDARVTLASIESAVIGQRVRTRGRVWEICTVRVGLSGAVHCYGVPVNKRTGKAGVRGYDLGDLEQHEFLGDGQ